MRTPGQGNSVTVKAKAMYANRLTREDFTALVSLNTTAEVVDYLKTHTAYADTLQGFSVAAPYRGQFAAILRIRLIRDLQTLIRYEKAAGLELYRYFVTYYDCLQILRRLRTLGEEIDEEYVALMPAEHVTISRLDLVSLMKAQTWPEVMACLENTEYRALFGSAEQEGFARENLIFMEAHVQAFCNRRLEQAVRKDCGKKQAAALLELARYENDLRTLLSLYRVKRLTDADEATLRRFVQPDFTLLTPTQLAAVLSAPTTEELVRCVEQTPYAAMFHGEDAQACALRLIARRLQKAMRYSNDAAQTLWCFVKLRELEMNDVSNIFEGVRCHASPEQIKRYIYCV